MWKQPRSVTVINRQQLQRQSTITNNLGDILGKLVPGFGPPNQADRFNAQSLRGREPAILIDGVPLQDRVSFNIQLRSIAPDAIEQNFQQSQKWGGRLQFDTPISENASILWGADYVNENDNTFARFSFDIDDYVNSGFRILRAIDETNDVPPYDYNSLGLFAQLQWDISQRWSLNGGARYEISKFLVDDYISADGESVEGGEVERCPTK